MLKWAKTIDWLAINTSALVLLVAIQLLSAFFSHPVEGPPQQTQSDAAYQTKQTEPGFNWGFWEAFFTGLIAAIAFREFYEARKSRERAQRAYIFMETCQFTRNPDQSGPWEIHLRIKNFGQTPAKDVVIRVERDLRNAIGKDEALAFSNTAETLKPIPMPPDHFNTTRAPILQGNADLNALRDAGRHIYVWAHVKYFDAFDVERSLSLQMVHDLGDVLEFSYCEGGNGFT